MVLHRRRTATNRPRRPRLALSTAALLALVPVFAAAAAGATSDDGEMPALPEPICMTVPAQGDETLTETIPGVPEVPEISHVVTSFLRYTWNPPHGSSAIPTDYDPASTPLNRPGDWTSNTTQYATAGNGTDPVGVPFPQNDHGDASNSKWFYWQQDDQKVVDQPFQPAVADQTITRPNPDYVPASTACVPPDAAVAYTEWIDQPWACGATETTQERTKTTIAYTVEQQGDAWVSVPGDPHPTTETQSRALTNAEIGTCPLGMSGPVTAVCTGDVPYLTWSKPTLPAGFTPIPGATMSLTFLNPVDSTQNYTVSGLPIAAGAILWPGATDGTVKNWPGWVHNADGSYSETTGNYRWTREVPGGVTVLFKVNPETSVQVTYPAATAACADPATLSTGISPAPIPSNGPTVSPSADPSPNTDVPPAAADQPPLTAAVDEPRVSAGVMPVADEELTVPVVEELAETGVEAEVLAGVAVVLMVAGVATVIISHRQTTQI